jgi:hypothetical protein
MIVSILINKMRKSFRNSEKKPKKERKMPFYPKSVRDPLCKNQAHRFSSSQFPKSKMKVSIKTSRP